MSESVGMYKRPEAGDDQPMAIFKRLITTCEELEFLQTWEVDVEFLLRTDSLVIGGRTIEGQCHMPKVQGMLKNFFLWMLEEMFGRVPDFLVTLDAELWESYTPKEREILIYHETCHMELKYNADGEPMQDEETGKARWALRGHDVEEFIQTVHRYGAYRSDIQAFVDAATGHNNAYA